MEIRGDSSLSEKGWELDRISVFTKDIKKNLYIPVHATIKRGRTHEFITKDVALPQNVPARQWKREEDLKEKREDYKLTPLLKLSDGTKWISIPVLKKLPSEQKFDLWYTLKLAGKGITGAVSAFFESIFGGRGDFDSIEDIMDCYEGIGNFLEQPSNTERYELVYYTFTCTCKCTL